MLNHFIKNRPAVLLLPFLLFYSGCAAFLPFVDEPAVDPDAARIQAVKDRYYRRSESTGRVKHVPTSGNPVLAKYIRELSSDKATKRTAAASYLGLMGEKAAPAVPALITALNDESHWVRRAAARALGKIGTPALDATDALRSAAEDKDPYVARTARLALEKLNGRGKRSILR